MHTKSQAEYVIDVEFYDFQADVYQGIPTTETVISSGNLGNISINARSTTIKNETIHRKVPTHNSAIKVIKKKTGKKSGKPL